jgi:acyl-CoA synthetase (AMP-forming)/AMP-acid ligase II
MTADNICAAIARVAEANPDRVAITDLEFAGASDYQATDVRFGALYRRACAFADRVAKVTTPGDRVLLLHASGAEFVSEFVGCLLARTLPVPTPAPANRQGAERLARIVADAGAVAGSVAADLPSSTVAGLAPALAALSWVDGVTQADELASAVPAVAQPGAAGRFDTAYLQYTSGSTDAPQGIEITHANLLGQARAISDALDLEEQDVMVNWLPVYHDMGLVFGILTPLIRGARTVTMSPHVFIRNPGRWLQAVSDFGGTISGGPSFAYDLCARRIPPPERQKFRLGTWRHAIVGAEPVRPETMARFTQAFAPSGFAPRALCPSYGLAEATLCVTTMAGRTPLQTCRVDRDALRDGRVEISAAGWPLVSCGRPFEGLQVKIVDPDTGGELPEDVTGEIWVAGWGVARGIFRQEEESAQVFRAPTLEAPDVPHLRTGDLGFLHGGELFVSGRRKDMIVIHGHNYYSEDIERAIEEAHPALREGCATAFPVDDGASEGIGVVCEIREPADEPGLRKVMAAMRASMITALGQGPRFIAFVPVGAMPRTSSGKRKRRECASKLESGGMRVRFREDFGGDAAGTADPVRPAGARTDPAALRLMLRRILGDHVGLPADRIGDEVPFAEYGLDSMRLQQMCAELELRLGQPVATSLIFDHPTIADLAAALAGPAPAADRDQPAPGRTAWVQ